MSVPKIDAILNASVRLGANLSFNGVDSLTSDAETFGKISLREAKFRAQDAESIFSTVAASHEWNRQAEDADNGREHCGIVSFAAVDRGRRLIVLGRGSITSPLGRARSPQRVDVRQFLEASGGCFIRQQRGAADDGDRNEAVRCVRP